MWLPLSYNVHAYCNFVILFRDVLCTPICTDWSLCCTHVLYLHYIIEGCACSAQLFVGTGHLVTLCLPLEYTRTATALYYLGMYSALLFVRTGHFVAPFVIHAYCNFMGFPDISEVGVLDQNEWLCSDAFTTL